MKIQNFNWLAAVIILSGCQTANQGIHQSELSLNNHPLVDKIWHVKSGDFVDKARLIQDMLDKEYVLLGETHDNPLHHQYQAWAIEQLHARGREMTVAFEMLTPEQEEVLQSRRFQSPDEIFDAVQWEQTGWPARELYRPVFAAALNAGYSVHAANIGRKELNQVIMQGEENLPADIKEKLKRNPLNEKAEELLRTGIVESHCQMLPDTMVPAMMLGQRVRDAVIADNVISHKGKDGTILIAGSGHTQVNGAYGFLKAADESAGVFTMAWMEVDERLTDPQDYREYWGAEVVPFDYVWFTPRIERPDPCEELKKHHKFSKDKQ